MRPFPLPYGPYIINTLNEASILNFHISLVDDYGQMLINLHAKAAIYLVGGFCPFHCMLCVLSDLSGDGFPLVCMVLRTTFHEEGKLNSLPDIFINGAC